MLLEVVHIYKNMICFKPTCFL